MSTFWSPGANGLFPGFARSAGGGGGSFVATATLDFKNGVYTWGGTTHTRAETVETNAAWGTFDTSHIVGGVGLRLIGTGGSTPADSFVLTSGAATGLMPAGPSFTCVVTYSLTFVGAGSHSAIMSIYAVNLPGFSSFWWFQTDAGGAHVSALQDGVLNIPVTNAAGPAHKAAFTFISSSLSAAVDGNIVATGGPPTNGAGATHVAVQCTADATGAETMTLIIEKIEFGAPIANGDLPGLSNSL